MTWDQIVLLVIGVTVAWLNNAKAFRWRRWACILGLPAQVIWFYWVGYRNQQYGVCFLSVMYFFAYGKGFYQQWVTPDE